MLDCGRNARKLKELSIQTGVGQWWNIHVYKYNISYMKILIDLFFSLRYIIYTENFSVKINCRIESWEFFTELRYYEKVNLSMWITKKNTEKYMNHFMYEKYISEYFCICIIYTYNLANIHPVRKKEKRCGTLWNFSSSLLLSSSFAICIFQQSERKARRSHEYCIRGAVGNIASKCIQM